MNAFGSLIFGKSSSKQGTHNCHNLLIISNLTSNIHICSKNVVKKNFNQLVSCALMSSPGTSAISEGLETLFLILLSFKHLRYL